jgi:hypothetical protein
MDVFQRQLLILAKQPYRVCKFSVHVLLRITLPFIEWRQVKFLKFETSDPPLRCNGLLSAFVLLPETSKHCIIFVGGEHIRPKTRKPIHSSPHICLPMAAI